MLEQFSKYLLTYVECCTTFGLMSKKTEMPIRNIRIEDATWKKLVKLSAPENVSILVRKILREYVAVDRE